MKPSVPDVLEGNVRLLLRRSYVPALPAPHFRDRLESLFLAELTRRAGRARKPVALRPLAALAAALLALLTGWAFLARDTSVTRANLLARHAVALGLPDGSWRAADDEERFHGVFFRPPSLIAVTPEGATLELLAGAGRVHLEERSELLLEAHEDELTATLRAGRAWFLTGDERTPLVPGEARLLRPTAPTVALTPTPAQPATGREAPPERASAAAPAVAVVPEHFLAGRLVVPEGEALPARFTVALLREKKGNEAHAPVRREFSEPKGEFLWPDPPPGKQRVFVFAEGHALCALGELDLSSGGTEVTARLELGARVSGSVLDVEGNPVAGALVFSENDAPTDALLLGDAAQAFWLPIQARTGPDGRFALEHLTPGLHALRASAPGLAPAWVEDLRVPLAPGEEPLFRLSAGGTVQGFVARDDGGPWAAAPMILVTMSNAEHRPMTFERAETGADGRYRFEHVPPMTMIVVLMRTSERPEVRPVQVVEGQAVRADFEVQRAGIHVHGRLLDHAGTPIARQNLGLFDRRTSDWNQDWVGTATLGDGAFDFENVAPGYYLIFLIDEMGRGLRCIDELELGPEPLDVEHELRLTTGRIAVRVTDAADGTAAEQTTLLLMRSQPDGRTDFAAYGATEADGRFTFTDLRPGTYRVIAYPSRHGLGYLASEPLHLATDESARLELALEAGGALDVVVRASDGRPLEGAAVAFRDDNGEEHHFSRLPLTDAAGRYHANGLRPGRYRLLTELDGYRGAPVDFQFELGRELEIPVLLTPTAPPR